MTSEQRIAELEDRVTALEDALGLTFCASAEWGLTGTEERLLGMLLKTSLATYERLAAGLWGDRPDPPDITNCLKVHKAHLNGKLRPLGVDIRANWRTGYYIPAEQKRLLDA